MFLVVYGKYIALQFSKKKMICLDLIFINCDNSITVNSTYITNKNTIISNQIRTIDDFRKQILGIMTA